MNRTNGTPLKMCGSCLHWIRKPPDVNNLGAPPNGECHQAPPQMTIFPNGQAISMYPTLPVTFPACGQHEANLVTNANGG